MCGRYAFAPSKKQQEAQLKQLDLPPVLQISFNIAPTQEAYIIPNDHPAQLQRVQWGLVPHWSADGINSGKLINARAESITEKPSFSTSIRQRRCIVPADSFYEWRKAAGGKKIPYRIFLKNGELLFMAGIWDYWGPQQHRTFAIITTAPNQEMSGLHNRMPVLLLDADARRRWLSDEPLESLQELLLTPPNGVLDMYRVSEQLNHTGANGTFLHERQAETPTLFDL
jgi:putative SOS response-associated peptidase YedK